MVRGRLFKLIFLTSLSVSMTCILGLAIWLDVSELAVGFLNLFVPLLLLVVLAVVLSVVAALQVSRNATRSLRDLDISQPDERDVEDEIKPLVRRLNDQNKQIRSQMEALAREHEKQDKLRREFTANVSHELKTPLTSISGIAEMLREGLVRPEDVQPFAGKIYDEAQRLISLVGDIIRLSRLEDPSVTVRMEPVSVYETAERVRQQLLALASKQQITLSLSGEEGWITGSPRILEEIIYNLCENAVQYNRPCGTVDMTVREDASEIRFTVRDTGIGVAREELERIFERFYRVDKSHSKEVGGTGLGLSIVKHGAASLGATVQVDSELNKGTTISVTFPKERL